jgi:pantoate--beta-alanine ligase
MIVIERVSELREHCDRARAQGRSVGLVPTMGFFHAGHRSLMRAARAENDLVVVTLFVNPTQFAPGEDLSRYPRDLEGDRSAAEIEGVDMLFVPPVEEVYPDGPPRTTVHVAGLTEGMCGVGRPTHFDGVTTVVAKLFSIVGPCTAYFGRKDYQQVAVITRMTRDLELPVKVVSRPLVREPDGLAMSSRNAYLDAEQRSAALVLHQALTAVADAVRDGERDASRLCDAVRAAVAEVPQVRLEYVEARDARTLELVERITDDTVLALAAQVGRTRLIDNVVLHTAGSAVEADLGMVIHEELS